MDTRTWALIPLAVAINVTMGALVGYLKLPLYLDSLGTVLVATLAGPMAGALTGAVSNGVSAFVFNPAWWAFIPVAAFIGFLAGLLARRGFMANPFLAALSGLLTGVAVATASAPIAAYVFGGATGAGTDMVVAVFRALGFSRLEASMAQGLAVDPVDKMVTFLVIQSVVAALPLRLRQGFPQGEALGRMRPLALPALGPQADRDHGERRAQGVAPPPTGLYRPGDGWLHRRAPLTKVLLLLTCVVAAVTVPAWLVTPDGRMPAPGLPLLAAGLLALAMASGVGLELARLVAALGLPMIVSMVLVNGLAAWSLHGALDALGLALRLLVCLEAAALLLLATPVDVLVADLERRGLPHRLGYVLLASMNLLPTMLKRSAEIREAQTARGLPLGAGLAGRLRGLLPMVGPLILGSVAEVEERALALEARGFGAARRRTWLHDPPGDALDPILQLLLVAATVALVVTRL